MATISKIGFIGIGNMGAPMAGHLVKKGFDVTVYDIQPERVKAFRTGGVDYVIKPFEAEEIVARVANHLSLPRLEAELARTSEELRLMRLEVDRLTPR